jgi:hypothetical protein
VVLHVSSETYWKGNESQDIVTLLEIVLMSTKKGGRDSKKQRAS